MDFYELKRSCFFIEEPALGIAAASFLLLPRENTPIELRSQSSAQHICCISSALKGALIEGTIKRYSGKPGPKYCNVYFNYAYQVLVWQDRGQRPKTN